MSEQSNKKTTEYQQKIKERVQASEQYFKKIKKQINIQDEKIKRVEQIEKQKSERIYRKANQYSISFDLNQNLEVPVDGQLERGSQVFMSTCSSCHTLDPTSSSGTVGPSLGLLYNRKVGSDPQYHGYSEGFSKSQQFWSARNLYKFMYNPQNFIKGTSCRILNGAGLRSQEDRGDIIQFLRQYSKELRLNIKIKEAKAVGTPQFQSDMYSKQKFQGLLNGKQ